MPVTGLFFIPANPNSSTALGTVANQLRAAYNAVPTGRWALEHKLLRDTPSCLPPSAYAPLPQLQPRFMHFLSLSHFQSHGFVYISDRPSPDPWAPSQPHHSQAGIHAHPAQQQIPPQSSSSNRLVKEEDAPQVSRSSSSSSSWTMMTLDPASFNSFLAITLRACEPLWCHRHTMLVTGGTIFEVGDFRIRIGDLRQTQPVQRVRGCIVEIEYRGPGQTVTPKDSDWYLPVSEPATSAALGVEDGFLGIGGGAGDAEEELLTEEDWVVGEKLIREFWGRFSVPGAKEAIRVPGLLTETNKARQRGTKRLTTMDAGMTNTGIAGADLARQYMELLRFNR
ncbi:hypothetical protein D8B26_000944 [Coccidioides posadasii str. Silveira]|uniref:Mediator of RNA polymerase II transcription subunit 20 n=2 Tax=Coccidioides posadasii TaxID=199306 RepID=E9CR30_COCPS|nr:hypothetical protein CPC735_040410 [Coccidioides posadasii C735 delta SOWgp]EER28777.1 hypothetical protein CPC735_040410 [Coccidioides posadasii C735 delta SOWgp]EFW22365.1 conserved hypothetical protein [Coccidioides posadasii str. Silveira]QVM06229.1 hypothetical protein D8B26_000944 [Coccidioides posadasii str. Silveira]|eukprot:XP_003070922.1 hypothetical protein CPC735_040410 [Coccidioides posadasii C735 delta SOWgp]